MVPREETAIAAVTSIPGSASTVLEFSGDYTKNFETAAEFSGTSVVFCQEGSSTLTTANTDGVAQGKYISVPACGIGAAKVVTAHSGSVTIIDTAATVSVTNAIGTGVAAYKLQYTCVLNGQIVARMALKGQDGGAAPSAVINEFVVGYGAIIPGCQLKDEDGTGDVTGAAGLTVHSDVTKLKILDAYVNQEIYAASPSGTDETFHCAQAYLDPKTHTFDDAISNYTRGQSYDNSGSYISGQDQAILPGIGVDNHRRRLVNTGLVTKIGFSGPSVQGPQHL